MVESCPESVLLHLWVFIVLSVSVRVNYLVEIKPLKIHCVFLQVDGGIQTTLKSNIFTFCCLDWLSRANGGILSCGDKHRHNLSKAKLSER